MAFRKLTGLFERNKIKIIGGCIIGGAGLFSFNKRNDIQWWIYNFLHEPEFTDEIYYKIIGPNKTNMGFKYKEGRNAVSDFNDNKDEDCGFPGLYFTTKDKLNIFTPLIYKEESYIGEVRIRKNSPYLKMLKFDDKIRANEIYITKIYNLKYLEFMIEFNLHLLINDLIYKSIINSDINILNEIKYRGYKIKFDSNMPNTAAKYGNVAVLKWLKDNSCEFDSIIVKIAQDHKQYKVLEWLNNNFTDKRFRCDIKLINIYKRKIINLNYN